MSNAVRWNLSDGDRDRVAHDVVDAVLHDLRGRRGIGDELDGLDAEVAGELRAALVLVVAAELPSVP